MENTHNPDRTRRKILKGMFSDRESTERAYNTLTETGYDRDEINLTMSVDTRKNTILTNMTTQK